MAKPIVEDYTQEPHAGLVAEGRIARRTNKARTACPYGIGKATAGGAVLRAQIIARMCWIRGWDAADRSIKRRKV